MGYDAGTSTATIKQSKHDFLVEETKKMMLPDEFPKLKEPNQPETMIGMRL